MKKIFIIVMALFLVGCATSKVPFVESNIFKSARSPNIQVTVNSEIEYKGTISASDYRDYAIESGVEATQTKELYYFVNENPIQIVFIYLQKINEKRSFFVEYRKNLVPQAINFDRINILGDSYIQYTAVDYLPIDRSEIDMIEKRIGPVLKKPEATITKVLTRVVDAKNKSRITLIYSEGISEELADEIRYRPGEGEEFLKEFEERSIKNLVISKLEL